jgi:HEAT repeat protein
MYATEQAAREGDTAAIERIIEQLDSDDPAVRWLAIRSLEHLTGRTNGYDHAAPEDERRAAIDRWRDDLATGRLSAEVAANG